MILNYEQLGDHVVGIKGEPGPYGAATELDLISHIICEFEKALDGGERIDMGDGCNHNRMVDGWALTQALDALRNYEALLRQPLFQLIPPGFYHVSRSKKNVEVR